MVGRARVKFLGGMLLTAIAKLLVEMGVPGHKEESEEEGQLHVTRDIYVMCHVPSLTGYTCIHGLKSDHPAMLLPP